MKSGEKENMSQWKNYVILGLGVVIGMQVLLPIFIEYDKQYPLPGGIHPGQILENPVNFRDQEITVYGKIQLNYLLFLTEEETDYYIEYGLLDTRWGHKDWIRVRQVGRFLPIDSPEWARRIIPFDDQYALCQGKLIWDEEGFYLKAYSISASSS